jgi:hypothetical protein
MAASDLSIDLGLRSVRISLFAIQLGFEAVDLCAASDSAGGRSVSPAGL